MEEGIEDRVTTTRETEASTETSPVVAAVVEAMVFTIKLAPTKNYSMEVLVAIETSPFSGTSPSAKTVVTPTVSQIRASSLMGT